VSRRPLTIEERATKSAVVADAKRDFCWTDEQLLDSLRHVARAYGRCTTETYLASYSTGTVKPSPRTFRMRFGSWANALDLAGLPTVHPARYSNRFSEEMLWQNVRACADEVGRVPSVAQYGAWARLRPERPCVALVRERLGGWGEVIRELSEAQR
jgi:hypothetical protein